MSDERERLILEQKVRIAAIDRMLKEKGLTDRRGDGLRQSRRDAEEVIERLESAQ